MTICRYFLQGTCRYGGRCRYEHTVPAYGGAGGGVGGGYSGYSGGYRGSNVNAGYSGGNVYGGGYGGGGGGGGAGNSSYREGAGTSILRLKSSGLQQGGGLFESAPPDNQPTYAAPPSGFFNQPVPAHRSVLSQDRVPVQHDSREILSLVKQEIIACEQGSQWVLSCFAPLREQGCIPGFEDHSPEELRWCMYLARKDGKIEECKQLIKELYDRARLCKLQFVNPPREVLEIIEQLARGEKLGAPMTVPLFEKLTASGGTFVTNAQSSGGVFGTTNAPGGIFGTTNAAAGIFGTTNVAGGTFGTPAQPGGIFGTPTNASGGAIGTPTNVSFGSNANSSLSTFKFALDSKPEASQNFPVFGGAQQSTVSNPLFGSNAQVQGSQSIFGGSTGNPLMVQEVASKSMFGANNNNNNNLEDSVIYTVMENLSEDMIKAYKAPTFTVGSVPIRPPPKELCS